MARIRQEMNLEDLEEPPKMCSRAQTMSSGLFTQPKSMAKSDQKSPPVMSYSQEVEVPCEDCGGTGRDIGALDPWNGEVCPCCGGSGRETITRNYLAEAFQIVANPDSVRLVERSHLVAIVQYCRQTVSAVVRLPEVA
jgi:hypothetical protein